MVRQHERLEGLQAPDAGLEHQQPLASRLHGALPPVDRFERAGNLGAGGQPRLDCLTAEAPPEGTVGNRYPYGGKGG